MLYRRETHHVGELSKRYDDAQAQLTPNAVRIEQLDDFAGVQVVLYANLLANLEFILDTALPPEDKAERLAQLAADSVTRKTFEACTDGIRYLADAICHGIQTLLTEPYRQAVLRLVGDAPDLEEARLRIARQKCLISQEER
jgi:hypothetical protein